MKYFLQLLGFAVVSEVPWYLLNGADGSHNVLFTLALGVMALAAFEALKKDGILCGAVILSIAGFATWSGVDYEWRGILMMVVFYILSKYNTSKYIEHKIVRFYTTTTLQVLLILVLMTYYGFFGSILSSVVILLYSGTRGCIKGAVAVSIQQTPYFLL